MDDFTVTPLGVLSDGTNLAMVLNLAPNQPDMLPEETMFIIDVCSLNIDNKPLSELLSSESLNTVYAYSEQQADGTYTFTCKIQMDATSRPFRVSPILRMAFGNTMLKFKRLIKFSIFSKSPVILLISNWLEKWIEIL